MLCLAFLQHPLLAQWQTNGGTIYYNGGNVGIGTSSRGERLRVLPIPCDRSHPGEGCVPTGRG
jgi:hypothetical protein